MAKKKGHGRSTSNSSRDSDCSRENSWHRRDRRGAEEKDDSRREDDRSRRREDREYSRSQSKSSSKFEERFADIQRRSRIDYSSEEESQGKKSKHAPNGAKSGVDEKSRNGKSRSRSQDGLEDGDSVRDERSGTSRKSRQSKYDDRSDLRDNHDRRGHDQKTSRNKRGAVGNESKSAGYESDASDQGCIRLKSRNKKTSRFEGSDDDSKELNTTPTPKKRGKRLEGELNRGFEKSERTGLRTTESDSDDIHRGRSGPESRTDNRRRDGLEGRNADRRTAHTGKSRFEDEFQRPDRSPASRRDNDRSVGETERYRNSGVRELEHERAVRDSSQRNGTVPSNERPEELTFRARELNNVPDPRSALCQRTDVALGVMDTRRDLADTDAFVFESPKGLRISTYVAAAISVMEALLGLGCGIFLLVDAKEQRIEDYKTYMVFTYMILHGLALLSGLLLIWANKKCQVDLMVTWIAVQISTGVVFICGAALFLLLELFNDNVPIEELLPGVPFIYFSSAFLIFIVLKVLTVAAVILRYQKLTFRPGLRPTPIDRAEHTWTEYQPSAEESRTPTTADASGHTRDQETEPGTPRAPAPTSVPNVGKSIPYEMPPPLRIDSINDERAERQAVSLRRTASENSVQPDRAQGDRDRSLRSTSSFSTHVSEPPRTTIPRVAAAKGLIPGPSVTDNRRHSPGLRDAHNQAMPLYLEDEPSRLSPQHHASGGERSSWRPEPESSQPNREISRPGHELSYTPQQPTYERHGPYLREPATPYSTQQASYSRDRSPYGESTYGNSDIPVSRRDPVARPIPAERHSLAARSVSERPPHPDFIPKKSGARPRYLPTGAVPAVGSPEEWGRNHHLYAPRSRQGEALQGGIRRHEEVYEPEPDY